MEENLHIVGMISDDDHPKEWQFIGLFRSEDLAIAACRTRNHFISEVQVGTDLGDTPEYFPNCRYPKREQE